MTRWLSLVLLSLSIFASSHDAEAQGFPTGVIRIVVPTSASTPPDILARIVANALSDEGLRVVVENKPGAAMSIGAMDVLKQPADGHTLFKIQQ
jgi:tripartite-type tricarboxylate transporter receptor subunit TctC